MGVRRALADGTARARRGLLARPLLQDALLGGALSVVSVLGALAHLHVDIPEGGPDVSGRGLDVLGASLVLLQTAPLALRRKAPVVVLGITTTAVFVASTLRYTPSLGLFGFLVALYTVAAHRRRAISIPAGVATAVVGFLIIETGHEPVDLDAVMTQALIVGAAWLLGDSLRIRRGQVVQLEDRATRLEREREEWTARAVAEERRVIARELHDVVAHHVSVIVAQAGAARRICAGASREAGTVLGGIERIGREALMEMRRLMAFLRTDREREDARSPEPGLANLGVLVEQVRDAGVPTDLLIEGDPRPLPPGLDLSAFRIIQEALTNVIKHAGPARTEVVVRYGRTRLDITVRDDGPGRRARPSDAVRVGYGHLGMRERIGLFGGHLRVGDLPGGGYQVVASLPLGEAAR